jgi:hypothetical protein
MVPLKTSWPLTLRRQLRPLGVSVRVEKSTSAANSPEVWTLRAADAERGEE